MYYVIVQMQSDFISGSLAEMLGRKEYCLAEQKSGVKVQCADLDAVSGLISAVSHTEMQVDGIEVSGREAFSVEHSAASN